MPIRVRGEASTEYLIDELLKRGCRVALPRVFGREMRFFYVTDRCQLVTGAYGIPEPADGCQEADAPKALVITPGVGFSKDGETASVMGRGIMTAFLRQNRTIWRWDSAMDSSCFRHLKPKSTIKKMARTVTPEQDTIKVFGGMSGALARSRNMSQATTLGARICQGTFFFKAEKAYRSRAAVW